MQAHNGRMSPFTAFFLGLFGVAAVGLIAATAITLSAVHTIDKQATSIVGFVANSIDGLPELIDSLPPALGDILDDRRAPEYAAEIAIKVNLITDDRGHLRPVMTIENKGGEMITMLAVRVAALNADNVPVREWTEVVATPIAIDHDWRGPIMPGKVRHVVGSRAYRGGPIDKLSKLSVATEISDIRVWTGMDGTIKTASAQ